MVAGADLLLDELSENKDNITLGISSRKMKDFDNVIIREHKLGLMYGQLI